jgi:hypothetical protein
MGQALVEPRWLQQIYLTELGHHEAAGKHAENTNTLFIHCDRTVKNGCISAELGLPQRIRNESHARATGTILVGREETSHQWGDTKRGKKVCLHLITRYGPRNLTAKIALPARAHGRQRLKRDLLAPPIEVGAHELKLVRIDRPEISDGHQAISVGIREWTEQQGVDGAEYRRGCADADGERRNGNSGKPGGMPESPKGISDILNRLIQPDPPVNGTHVFECSKAASELTMRCLPRIGRAQTLPFVPLPAHGEMRVDLFSQLIVRFHASPITLCTPFTTEVQFLAASASRLSPVFVMA